MASKHPDHTAALFFLTMLVWGLPTWLAWRHRPPPAPAPSASPAEVSATPNWTPPPIAFHTPPPPPPPVATPAPSVDPFQVDTLPLHVSSGAALRMPGTLAQLARTADSEKTAVAWRQAADAAAHLGFHQVAAHAYGEESAVYRKTGDVQAAEAERMKAESHTATLTVCYQRPVAANDLKRLYSGARLEPGAGCYIGAFIDRDEHLTSEMQDGGQTHGSIPEFAKLTGRPHASYFMYLSYGMPFPTQWVESLKAEGAIPHIAWEPKSLDEVADNDYLQGFAAAAKEADWPMFIRFAGEMNGDWTPWHKDPAGYRKAFQTVYKAFHDSRNVAIMWCPNAIPRANIDDYYPGDDYVDWVGVNFYSVMYLNDDPKQPGDQIHPTDLLDPIYQKYSARKPIAIGEYAATHQSNLDKAPRPDFAIHRIHEELYGALQTQYPRVKMINWYDRNNLKHPDEAHRLNNYLLTDEDSVLHAYRQAIAPDWFLGPGPGGAPGTSPFLYAPLQAGTTLGTDVTVRASVRCWTQTPHVYFSWDGKIRHATRDPGSFGLHLSNVPAGPHVLKVMVQDDDSRPVSEGTWHVQVKHS